MKQTAAALLTVWVAVGVVAAAVPAHPHRGDGEGSASVVLAPSLRQQPRPALLAVGARHNSAAHAAAELATTSVPMETVVHSKEAGDGYKKGSPLYGKQEASKVNTTISHDGDAKSLSKNTSPVDFWRYWAEYPVSMLTIHLAYILIMAAVAYAYRILKAKGHLGGASLANEEAPFPYEGDAFTYGFVDVHSCKQDWPIWLSACCCPMVRWSDTVSAPQAPLLDFWTAIFMMIALEVLGPLTWFGSSFFVVLVGIYFRQRLRLLFGHEPKRCKTVALDFLAWCCCPLCAIVQEAKEVEKVRRKPAGQVYLPPQAH